jgi:hypothetical protein
MTNWTNMSKHFRKKFFIFYSGFLGKKKFDDSNLSQILLTFPKKDVVRRMCDVIVD